MLPMGQVLLGQNGWGGGGQMKGLHRNKVSTGHKTHSSITDFSYSTYLYVKDRQPGGLSGSSPLKKYALGELNSHLLPRCHLVRGKLGKLLGTTWWGTNHLSKRCSSVGISQAWATCGTRCGAIFLAHWVAELRELAWPTALCSSQQALPCP